MPTIHPSRPIRKATAGCGARSADMSADWRCNSCGTLLGIRRDVSVRPDRPAAW